MQTRRRQLLLTLAGLCACSPPSARALPVAPVVAGAPPFDAPVAAPPPALPLALPYDGRVDPALCLVSEKLDGVRAVWDGAVLRHRSGRAVAAPAWFMARLPRTPLDGELWLGRGRFEALSAAVRRQHADDAEWLAIRYMVFEQPDAGGSFAERALAIEHLVAEVGWPALQAVAQTRVGDRRALQRRLDAIVAQGGEGLVLHLAAAPWSSGRGDALMKLKPWLDAEAAVVGHRAGRGKYAGAVGALELETPQGRRFFVGSGLPDSLRRHPPAPGTLVTYRYHDLTGSGLPRFASFLRLHEAL